MRDNVVVVKSYGFALKIVKLHLTLTKDLRQFDLASQILRSGTSIGANVEESQGRLSRKEFIYKLSIAYREARETKYWLRLLIDSAIIPHDTVTPLINDCEELLRLLYSIINSARK